MRKLMILDPQAIYVDSLQKQLDGYCEIIVCDQYSFAAETIAQVRPDFMIVDFTAPEFEGFTVLRSALALGANPAVIGIIQSSFYFDILCRKEKNICSTVFRPFNQAVLASRITRMMELPPEELVPVPTRSQFVGFMLNALGIPTAWEGGKNLVTIIPLAADHPEMKVTKHLYPAAVKESGDPVENVERNIRQAIDHGFRNAPANAWARYFPADESGRVKKPSNAKFIALLAEILNQQKGQYREDV